MARDTNGIQTVKKPHGIETKVPIQSGNVSKRKTIEALTESARTGNLASSVRTSSIASVALCSDTITTNPHVFKVNVGNGFQWIVAIAIVQ